jgi:hypothetical protein
VRSSAAVESLTMWLSIASVEALSSRSASSALTDVIGRPSHGFL